MAAPIPTFAYELLLKDVQGHYQPLEAPVTIASFPSSKRKGHRTVLFIVMVARRFLAEVSAHHPSGVDTSSVDVDMYL
jgi:hypothetical protein